MKSSVVPQRQSRLRNRCDIYCTTRTDAISTNGQKMRLPPPRFCSPSSTTNRNINKLTNKNNTGLQSVHGSPLLYMRERGFCSSDNPRNSRCTGVRRVASLRSGPGSPRCGGLFCTPWWPRDHTWGWSSPPCTGTGHSPENTSWCRGDPACRTGVHTFCDTCEKANVPRSETYQGPSRCESRAIKGSLFTPGLGQNIALPLVPTARSDFCFRIRLIHFLPK